MLAMQYAKQHKEMLIKHQGKNNIIFTPAVRSIQHNGTERYLF